MNKFPKVSVIIPIYKVEKFLEECVESVLEQTYTSCEIILVDDGSPDLCPQMCDKYAARNSNVKVIHKENGGLSSARLAGFENAQGEYILFVDSDDYIDKCMVEKLVKAIEEKDAQMAICAYNVDCEGKIAPKKLSYEQTSVCGREKIVENYILPLIGERKKEINLPGFMWIRLFRRDLIRKEFFVSERKVFMEDHVFNLLYADNINKIAIINEPLYNYRINRTSLSNCYRKNKWEMYANLYDFFESYLKERNIVDFGRLNGFLINAIFQCIDNAVLSGEISLYQKELKIVIDDKRAEKVVNEVCFKTLSTMQTIMIILLRLHMYQLIYIIRMKRLRKFLFGV